MQEGYNGLLRDKTRPSRIRPLRSNVTERVVTLTQTDLPAHAVVLSVDEKSQIQALFLYKMTRSQRARTWMLACRACLQLK